MKFYESGDNRKPVIFLFPGTCCLYSSFDHVLDGLHSYFYTVAVSYDGFDPNEKTEFYSMEDECEKIEQEIRTKYGGRIKAAYGCLLFGGEHFVLLIASVAGFLAWNWHKAKIFMGDVGALAFGELG